MYASVLKEPYMPDGPAATAIPYPQQAKNLAMMEAQRRQRNRNKKKKKRKQRQELANKVALQEIQDASELPQNQKQNAELLALLDMDEILNECQTAICSNAIRELDPYSESASPWSLSGSEPPALLDKGVNTNPSPSSKPDPLDTADPDDEDEIDLASDEDFVLNLLVAKHQHKQPVQFFWLFLGRTTPSQHPR